MAKKSAKVSQEFGTVRQVWQKCRARVAEVQGKRGRSAGQAWQKCRASVAEVQGKRGRSVVQAWQKERSFVHFSHRKGANMMEEKLSNVRKTKSNRYRQDGSAK